MPTTNYATALLRLRPLQRLRPLLLSTSICLMDRGGLDRGICRLPTIHPSNTALRFVACTDNFGGILDFTCSGHFWDKYKQLSNTTAPMTSDEIYR